MSRPLHQPVSASLPFDNSTNGYAADNAQDAIEETRVTAGSSRTPYGFYYDATANSGRWLEVSKGVSSETSPHIIPEVGIIKAIAFSVKSNTTCTVTIYKNASVMHTLSLSSSQVATLSGLSTNVIALDEISAQITSGTCTEPNLQVHTQVNS